MIVNWFGKAESLKAEIDSQTEQQIMSQLRAGNDLVSIPFNTQKTKRGDSVTFGVGIRNVGSEKKMHTRISFANAYTPEGRENSNVDKNYIEEKWLGNFATTENINLKRNEMKVIPMMIKTDNKISTQRQTPKGDYTFNLCIFDGSPAQYCDTSLMATDVLYSDKIYQLTVRVD